MLRPSPAFLAFAALGLLAPAGASAATKTTFPTISNVAPKKLTVGEKLTITGKGFRTGKLKNTVVFKRDGKPGLFVRSDTSTSTKMTVTVPDKLATLLATSSGADGAATFRLRVITSRFSKTFTAVKESPIIAPRQAAGAPGTPGAAAALTPYQVCQAGVAGTPVADSDSDGLTNATEGAVHTDPCTADTDGDGMVDGYEYASALDLNSSALPYPGKRPWPNPLDPTDGVFDFDGDGLLLSQEYALWRYVGATFPVSAYSDGTQNSGGTMPTIGNPGRQALDIDGDGNLSDDERDGDGDGLSNVVETNLRGTVAWWSGAYPDEKPYSISRFAEPAFTDPDTDGDGVPDAADDQDHDGWDNYHEMELSRGDQNVRVQPFNPCLPDPYSRTCSRYVPFSGAWPPFDGTQDVGSVVPFDLANTAATSPSVGWNGTGGTQGS
jgi:hypothetical protein